MTWNDKASYESLLPSNNYNKNRGDEGMCALALSFFLEWSNSSNVRSNFQYSPRRHKQRPAAAIFSVTWLIVYWWHDSFDVCNITRFEICATYVYIVSRSESGSSACKQMCNMNYPISLTWPMHICDVTLSYVWPIHMCQMNHPYVCYGAATISRLLQITGLFCKRAP